MVSSIDYNHIEYVVSSGYMLIYLLYSILRKFQYIPKNCKTKNYFFQIMYIPSISLIIYTTVQLFSFLQYLIRDFYLFDIILNLLKSKVSMSSDLNNADQQKYGDFFHKYTSGGSPKTVQQKVHTNISSQGSLPKVDYSTKTYTPVYNPQSINKYTSEKYQTIPPTKNYKTQSLQTNSYNSYNYFTPKQNQNSFKEPYKFSQPVQTKHTFTNPAFNPFDKTKVKSPVYDNILSATQGNKDFTYKQKKINQDILDGLEQLQLNEQKHVLKRTNSFDEKSNSKTNETKQKLKYSDFQIGKKLGKGMFGQVLLVKHKATGWICGLKVMEKKIIREQKYAGQIARELSIQFYLSHHNILQLYGYFEDENNFYLLIELCPGGSLYGRLKQQRRMSQKDVSTIIRQITEGIDFIHSQFIIHRDIKPQNIIFSMGVVKICDFGWSVYRGHGMRKTASGSPLYYPPQIVKGEQYDDKIDIWCIGMMAYECIIGKIPFRVYTEMDLGKIVSDQITFPEWVQVSDQAKDFILKILKKRPEQRMQIGEILRHPFIKRYQQNKINSSIVQDFKKIFS